MMLENPIFTNRHGERLDTAFHPGTRENCLIILGHGVTGNKDRPLLIAIAEGLAADGWPCLRMSFAGNGESGGDFRAATIRKESEDLQSVLDSLPTDLRVAYIGHSMGGAVGVLTASKDPRIQVLVSLAGMMRTLGFCEREFGGVTPDQGFMWDDPECPLSQAYVDDLSSIGDLFDEVSTLSQPWLLIHGTEDDLVFPEDSDDAYTVANDPKRIVRIDGAEHCFDETSYPQVIKACADWLREHLQ